VHDDTDPFAWSSRPRLQHHPIPRADGAPSGTPVPGETRLDLGDLSRRDAVAAPTVVVKPIPAARRRAAQEERGGYEACKTRMAADADGTDGAVQAAALINRVLDEQAELNARGADRLDALTRVRRVGPGGLWGWKPLQAPNVHEVAAARQKAADREESRRHAHARHVDRLEICRAYAKLAILLALFLLVVGAGWIGFMILTGHYAWTPTRVS